MKNHLFQLLLVAIAIVTVSNIADAAMMDKDQKADLIKSIESEDKALDIRNLVQVDERVFSAGQPSEQALQSLKASGIKVIVNLRGVDENSEFDEANTVKKLGLEYHALPIEGASDVSFENAQKLADILSQSRQKVLVHCASGNRVGALMALNHFEKNQDVEAAIAAGKKAGMTRLESKVREIIEDKAREE